MPEVTKEDLENIIQTAISIMNSATSLFEYEQASAERTAAENLLEQMENRNG